MRSSAGDTGARGPGAGLPLLHVLGKPGLDPSVSPSVKQGCDRTALKLVQGQDVKMQAEQGENRGDRWLACTVLIF